MNKEVVSVVRQIDDWALEKGGSRWGAIGVWICTVLFLGPIALSCCALIWGLLTIDNGIYAILAFGVAIGWTLNRKPE